MALNNTYYLNVDIKRLYTADSPKFRRGDSGILVFTLYDNGVRYDISSATTATIYQRTQSGENLEAPCTIEMFEGRRVIKYEFKKSDTKDIGFNSVVLVVNDGTNVISIQPFEVVIYDDLLGGSGSFLELIQDLMKIVNEMNIDLTNTIKISEKGVPNGVASLDSNGVLPVTQLPNSFEDYQDHTKHTVFKDRVHGMRISSDGELQYKTPTGYENAGYNPNKPANPFIDAQITVSEGVATITYTGNLNVLSQKWAQGNMSLSYFNSNGNEFTGNTFNVTSIGMFTFWYKDETGGTHLVKFEVTQAMLPTTNVTVVVNEGVVDVTISRPVTIKKWDSGERDIAHFTNNGTVFTGNTFEVTEVGIYTIYYKIDTGVEYVYVFEVTEDMLPKEEVPGDTTPPELSIFYSGDYSDIKVGAVIATFRAIDTGSGVDRIILPDGGFIMDGFDRYHDYTITTNGNHKFTVYDKAGNKTEVIKNVSNIGTPVKISTLTPGTTVSFANGNYTLIEKEGSRNLITYHDINKYPINKEPFDYDGINGLFPNATILHTINNTRSLYATLDETNNVIDDSQWNYGTVDINTGLITNNMYTTSRAGLLTVPQLLNALNNNWIIQSTNYDYELAINHTSDNLALTVGSDLQGGAIKVYTTYLDTRENIRHSYYVNNEAIGYI